MKNPEQPDLFNDWEEVRIFHCIGGHYIGHFNRYHNPMDEDDPGSVIRLSDYFNTKNEAETALKSGLWPAPNFED